MRFLLKVSIPTEAGSFALEGCTVRISREGRDSAWDSFVARCPGGHHEQTSLWGEVKGVYGWQSFRIVVTRENEILGGVQVLTRCVGRWGRIGYVSRGPLAASGDPELVHFILGQLDQAAVRERLAYLAVVLPYNGHVFEPVLHRLGFRQKPDVLPPSGVTTATLLLDLAADVDTLMAGMRASTRRNVRVAARQGVTVREGTGRDVETFRQLMWALCERRGSAPAPPQKDFFEHLWRIFHPLGFVGLLIAELEGRAISAVLIFPFGDTVRFWKIGWAGDHAKSFPNELLYWEAICWSKRRGYRFFDIVSVEKSLALKLRRGDPVDWTSVKGTDHFKLGFGASPVVLPEPYYRFYHPLLRILAHAGGRRLLESPAVAHLLGRFWGRLVSGSEG